MAERQTSIGIVFSADLSAVKAEVEAYAQRLMNDPLKIRFAPDSAEQSPATFGTPGTVTPIVKGGQAKPKDTVGELFTVRQNAIAAAGAVPNAEVSIGGYGRSRVPAPNSVYSGNMTDWLNRAVIRQNEATQALEAAGTIPPQPMAAVPLKEAVAKTIQSAKEAALSTLFDQTHRALVEGRGADVRRYGQLHDKQLDTPWLLPELGGKDAPQVLPASVVKSGFWKWDGGGYEATAPGAETPQAPQAQTLGGAARLSFSSLRRRVGTMGVVGVGINAINRYVDRQLSLEQDAAAMGDGFDAARSGINYGRSGLGLADSLTFGLLPVGSMAYNAGDYLTGTSSRIGQQQLQAGLQEQVSQFSLQQAQAQRGLRYGQFRAFSVGSPFMGRYADIDLAQRESVLQAKEASRAETQKLADENAKFIGIANTKRANPFSGGESIDNEMAIADYGKKNPGRDPVEALLTQEQRDTLLGNDQRIKEIQRSSARTVAAATRLAQSQSAATAFEFRQTLLEAQGQTQAARLEGAGMDWQASLVPMLVQRADQQRRLQQVPGYAAGGIVRGTPDAVALEAALGMTNAQIDARNASLSRQYNLQAFGLNQQAGAAMLARQGNPLASQLAEIEASRVQQITGVLGDRTISYMQARGVMGGDEAAAAVGANPSQQALIKAIETLTEQMRVSARIEETRRTVASRGEYQSFVSRSQGNGFMGATIAARTGMQMAEAGNPFVPTLGNLAEAASPDLMRARLVERQAQVAAQTRIAQQRIAVAGDVQAASERMAGQELQSQLTTIRTQFAAQTYGMNPAPRVGAVLSSVSPDFAMASQREQSAERLAQFGFNFQRTQFDIGLRGEAQATTRLLGRDPVGAQAYRTAASFSQRVRDAEQAYGVNSPEVEALRANAEGEFARQRQEYKLSFRAEQINPFEIMPFNPRDTQNPQDVLDAISAAEKQVGDATVERDGSNAGGQLDISPKTMAALKTMLQEAIDSSLSSRLDN